MALKKLEMNHSRELFNYDYFNIKAPLLGNGGPEIYALRLVCKLESSVLERITPSLQGGLSPRT